MTVRLARRIAIGIVGATVLALGIVLIIAPGPAFIVIPIGLAILGMEFAWARRWLGRLRQHLSAENSKRYGEQAEQHRNRHSRS